MLDASINSALEKSSRGAGERSTLPDDSSIATLAAVGERVPAKRVCDRGEDSVAPPRAPSGSRNVAPRRQQQTILEVPRPLISDDAMRALIDESIVPALLQKFMREKRPLSSEQLHNGQQP